MSSKGSVSFKKEGEVEKKKAKSFAKPLVHNHDRRTERFRRREGTP